MIDVECVVCGKKFQAQRRTRIYCDECGVKGASDLWRAHNPNFYQEKYHRVKAQMSQQERDEQNAQRRERRHNQKAAQPERQDSDDEWLQFLIDNE
jgi:hypothetical protein